MAIEFPILDRSKGVFAMRTLFAFPLILAMLVGCAHRADSPGGATAAEPIMVAIL